MKKLNYIIFAFLLPFSGFTQNSRAFYGSSVSRSYGVDTLAGFKAVNTNTLGYAGLVAISDSDTSVFFTNGTGYASIYNSAGVLRQPQYVGVGGSPDPSGSAYLSFTGTGGGFLAPRMTAAQKNAIASPATGLLIYQTDGTPGFYYYTGSAWSAVGGGSSGITVGTTTITSGTTTNIPFNLAGVYQEANSANFDYLQFIAQTGSTGSKVRIGPSTYINTPVNGTGGVIVGDSKAMAYGDSRYVLGRDCMDGSNSIGIGQRSGYNGTLNNSIVIGSSSVLSIYPARSAVIAIGHSITGLQADNIGYWGSATYWNDVIYFNDATASTAKSIILSACGGSSANGALMTLQGGAGGGTDKNAGGLTLTSGTSSGTGTGTILLKTPTPGATGTGTNAVVTRLTIDDLSIAAALPIKLSAYTVATLPAGAVGMTAYVTDATAPTYLGALVGGGAVVTPVFYNGAAWVSY